MSFIQRLLVVCFVLSSGWLICRLYFTAGLERPASGEHPIDKWWHMLLTHIGNIIFYWEWVLSLYRLGYGFYEQQSSILDIIIRISLGFYFAMWLCDVIAGTVHWFGDTADMYFFSYHHRDSRYMTRQSYVHHCWDSLALALILSVIIPPFRTSALLTTVRIIACQANEAHMWAHCTSKEIPPLVKSLQSTTVILSWKSHKDHHKPPHLKDYCVFNGWANPIMNKILRGPVTQWVETNIRDNPKWIELKKVLDT